MNLLPYANGQSLPDLTTQENAYNAAQCDIVQVGPCRFRRCYDGTFEFLPKPPMEVMGEWVLKPFIDGTCSLVSKVFTFIKSGPSLIDNVVSHTLGFGAFEAAHANATDFIFINQSTRLQNFEHQSILNVEKSRRHKIEKAHFENALKECESKHGDQCYTYEVQERTPRLFIQTIVTPQGQTDTGYQSKSGFLSWSIYVSTWGMDMLYKTGGYNFDRIGVDNHDQL